MEQQLAQESLDQGLFTFYMADNEGGYFNSPNAILSPIAKENSFKYQHGRKQKKNYNNYPSIREEPQTLQEKQKREQNLNKFLSNCVGAMRRVKPSEKVSPKGLLKRYTQPVSLPSTSSVERQNKEYQIKIQSTKAVDLILGNNESGIRNNVTKKQSKSQKLSMLKAIHNEIGTANASIVRLQINASYRQSRSQSQKEGKSLQVKKQTNKNNDLKNKLSNPKKFGKKKSEHSNSKSELKEIGINFSKDYVLLQQKIEKIEQFNKLSQCYPRLIKHHSEQLFIKSTARNGISISTLVPTCGPEVNILNHSSIPRMSKLQYESEKLQLCLNILQNPGLSQAKEESKIVNPILRLPNIKPRRDDKQNCENKILQMKMKPKMDPSGGKNVFISDISSHILKQHEKRNNRLQLMYKNKKCQLGSMLGTGNIQLQEEKKINEIYYSIDNKQKKALEINFGVNSKVRILDGFQQRKRVLLDKINLSTDRKKPNLRLQNRKNPQRLQIKQNKKTV